MRQPELAAVAAEQDEVDQLVAAHRDSTCDVPNPAEMVAPEAGPVVSVPERICSLLRLFQTFVIENFLVVGFSCALIVSLSWPIAGATLSKIVVGEDKIRIIEFLNNCFVFLVSGLSLKTDELAALFQHRYAILYGIVTINFITTLIAFIMIRLPFSTKEFAVGLTIFSTVPTTLGVGVALTLASKGDQALALFLTISSNMLGTVTIPALLGIYLSGGTVVQIDPVQLIFKLSLTVLIPSIVGITLRRQIKAVAEFMKKYKTEMGLFSNSNLICIVWMALSTSRNTLLKQKAQEIVLVIVTAFIMHVFYLAYNYTIVTRILRLKLKQTIAVTIMASQKSSPVALAVITNITKNTAQAGLFTLPCVIGQLLQIFVGSFVAKHFATRVVQEDKEAKEKAAADLAVAEASAVNSDDNGDIDVSEPASPGSDEGQCLVPSEPLGDVEIGIELAVTQDK